jgi:hypothetical protein
MKNYSLIAILFANLFCFAQEPNPDLIQTWYLVSAQGTDMENYIYVTDVSPTVMPTLTVAEDYTFTGTGACNTFSGAFNFGVFEDGMSNIQTTQFTRTTETCVNASHTYLENLYFGHLIDWTYMYEISNNNEGMFLSISTPFFSWISFQNYPLSSQQLEEQKIQVYPNPSSSKIFIKSDELTIQYVEILNLLGQRVKITPQNFNEIEISSFDNGVYLLQLHTENNIITKRIVKK